MLKDAIKLLIKGEDLSSELLQQALLDLFSKPNAAQASAFLALMQAKGETANELFLLVEILKNQMHQLAINKPVLDIVGTGGDGARTVNISTGSALLAAACGVYVAKHGNRAVSSQCGAADVIEAMQLPLTADFEVIQQSIEQHHFGFCYAPLFHAGLQKMKEVRRALGVSTMFNLVGPLLNPAAAEYLLLGVGQERHVKLLAEVLIKLPIKHALVFHGYGLDELTTLGPIEAIEVKHGKLNTLLIDPKQFGFATASLNNLIGGDALTNAHLLHETLGSAQSDLADTLILNAGVANYIYGLVPNIHEGIVLARFHQQQGSAIKLLSKLRQHAYV